MSEDSEFMGDGDPDDAFCEGDTPDEDVNYSEVAKLVKLQDEALSAPEGDDRSWAVLALLGEMYGEDLVVF